jgi:hypothetical protein
VSATEYPLAAIASSFGHFNRMMAKASAILDVAMG